MSEATASSFENNKTSFCIIFKVLYISLFGLRVSYKRLKGEMSSAQHLQRASAHSAATFAGDSVRTSCFPSWEMCHCSFVRY